MARRYHWHSVNIRDFTSEPHTAIVGEHQGAIMNLVDGHAWEVRNALLSISKENPDRILQEARKLSLPVRHPAHVRDVNLERLGAVLGVAYESNFSDFASLLLLENLGPRKLQSMALLAEVVHGTPTRFSDPARFFFALGGKDRHPFPVPLKTYDESIAFLLKFLESAKLGNSEKIKGFRRLEAFTRTIESRFAPQASELLRRRQQFMDRASGVNE